MSNVKVKATPSESLAMACERNRRESVLKSLCSYYDPQRIVFGKQSKCLSCCKGCQGSYDPTQAPYGDDDKPCKRWEGLERWLPTADQAKLRYF